MRQPTSICAMEAANSSRDAGRSMLPPEQSMLMPLQDFNKRPARASSFSDGQWVTRAALFGGALLLTYGFARELHAVLSFVQITPLQVVFLILSTLAFGWIALGSLSAAVGLMPLFAGERHDTLELPEASGEIQGRTALLFPVYHEDSATIAGTIEAIAEDLASLGKVSNFEVFILSDSRSAESGQREEAVFATLAQRLGDVLPVYYRRRR